MAIPLKSYSLPGRRGKLTFSKTLIMGVVNATPDSFSDGGCFNTVSSGAAHAKTLLADGADIIDIGGESSRPFSEPVSIDEELNRVIPIIQKVVSANKNAVISIDTYKPEVAKVAIEEGATIINDITGLSDESMRKVAAKCRVPVVIMHMKGTPKTMQKRPAYKNVVTEVGLFFKKRIELAKKSGVEKLILDPGIGFGKSVNHNLTLINNLGKFERFRLPILVGASRKSFLGKILDIDDPLEREEATLAISALAISKGVSILRVHDVAANRKVALVADAITKEKIQRR